MRTLKYGASGDDVKELCSLLGIGEGDAFDERVEAAVKAYQTSYGLEADGIVGPLTWAALLGKSVAGKKPVDYKQYDKRWGNVGFTSCGNTEQTIRNSGCGPTAMANIVATFFDASVTPREMAALVVKKGYRTRSDGTAWGFFDWIATKYEFGGYERTLSHSRAVSALGKGALIVASMGPGYWTKGGHFITLWKCEGGYMYANDPASSSRKRQALGAFKKQVKKYFIFFPPVGWGDEPENEEAVSQAPVIPADPASAADDNALAGYVPGAGIYDVSKWQGKIDWDKAAKSGKIALMILRAGYGRGNVDERFVRNATFCRRYGIPFAVYWYSYADSVERILSETKSFYETASPYSPLWYCLDCEEGTLTGEMIDAGTKRLREMGAGKIVNYIANHRFARYKCDTSLPDGVWIPLYIKNQPPKHRPCDLWQYGGEKVPGIGKSAIDANRIPKSSRFPLEWFLSA